MIPTPNSAPSISHTPNTEYHWENPRVCCTCTLFENCLNNGDPYFCEDASEPNPCTHYTPKQTD